MGTREAEIRDVLTRATGTGWEAAYRQDVGHLLARVDDFDTPGEASSILKLRARVAELEATIAAERGESTGALPGWEWTSQSWRSGDQIVIRVTFGAWDVLVRVPGAPVEILRVVTAREGMRLANERADAARAVAK